MISTDFAIKILELIDSPEKRARMGEIGRQRFRETLAWDHQEAILLQAYDAVFALEPLDVRLNCDGIPKSEL